MGSVKFNVVIVCVGGGSNVVGVYFYYLNEFDVCFIVVEVVGKGVYFGELVVISILGIKGIIYGSWMLFM